MKKLFVGVLFCLFGAHTASAQTASNKIYPYGLKLQVTSGFSYPIASDYPSGTPLGGFSISGIVSGFSREIPESFGVMLSINFLGNFALLDLHPPSYNSQFYGWAVLPALLFPRGSGYSKPTNAYEVLAPPNAFMAVHLDWAFNLKGVTLNVGAGIDIVSRNYYLYDLNYNYIGPSENGEQNYFPGAHLNLGYAFKLGKYFEIPLEIAFNFLFLGITVSPRAGIEMKI
ncbi:MAG: hypothetical protein JNM63_06940 [Spirochaetia bacterium]|nr:hypothetical protein [Spirochaetia bacterium]